MSNQTSSKQPVADLTTAVPTQRIVTAGATSAPERRRRAPRSKKSVDLDGAAVDLPDLSAVLATIPGGLGAEIVEAFTYAGQRWTAADARVNGTPIGLQLAMEQRGLEVSGGDLDLPLQRAIS
jgi:hypothetical protein